MRLECIASGEAAKKSDAQFVQDAEMGRADVAGSRKNDERTPGYLSHKAKHRLSSGCNDYCAYLGQSSRGTRGDGHADEVLEEMDGHEYTDIREYLYKDGDSAGIFRCLHCGKYHIYVDAII